MTRTTEVPTREPVSHILREAARLSLRLRPEALPLSAWVLFAAIDEALEPLRGVEEPLRRRIALDTTIALCAEHAGERLMPAAVQRVEGVIARCFALHDLPRSCVARALKMLSIFCGGGIPVPSLMDLANQVRDEQIRRAYRDGAGYPFLARRHGLTPRRIRQIVNPPRHRAAPGRREETYRTLAGRARRPGRLLTHRRGSVPAGPSGIRHPEPYPPGPAPERPRVRPARETAGGMALAREQRPRFQTPHARAKGCAEVCGLAMPTPAHEGPFRMTGPPETRKRPSPCTASTLSPLGAEAPASPRAIRLSRKVRGGAALARGQRPRFQSPHARSTRTREGVCGSVRTGNADAGPRRTHPHDRAI